MPENDMLEDIEFENQINALGDDQPALIKFVARQQYDTSKVLGLHEKRIKGLERSKKKLFGLTGGIGAIIGAIIAAIVDFMLHK